MTRDEVQQLIACRQDLSEVQQIQAFTLIMDDFIHREAPHEAYFAAFGVEHFINGYITMQPVDPGLPSLVQLCAQVGPWLHTAEEKGLKKEAQVLYFLCRFFSFKGMEDYLRPLCLDFIASNQSAEGLDTIVYSYIKHFSVASHSQQAESSLRTLQANIFIQHSLQESRKALSADFLDDPYASAFAEYPAPVRGMLARIYYLQNTEQPPNNT